MKRIRVDTNDGGTSKVLDSLTNFLTGMGMENDKMFHAKWMHRVIDRAQLNAAYRGDWIARKIVDIPANDATREGRAWQADKDDITLIEQVENDHQIMRKINLANKRGRLYGGAALILGVRNDDPAEPLIPERIKRDSLEFVHVVTRYELTAAQLSTDVLSPYYGRPEFYTSTANSGMAMRIHPSRVIPFYGMEHPDPMNGDSMGWGDSVLQIVADAIKSCSTVSQSVASLLGELQVDIVKIPGMTNKLKTADYEERLKRRFGLAATAKSIYKILMIDKEEEWQRINANLSGMHDLIKTYLLIASGAADIPATRMLGQSPTGLSATGESDIRNYYDRIVDEQKNVISPAIRMLDELVVRSALGNYPDGLFYVWKPLWQMDDEQKAKLDKSKADTFAIDVNSGVIDPTIMREARINQLIEDNVYPGLEQIVEEADLEEEVLVAEEESDPDEEDADQDVTTDAKRKRIRVSTGRYRPRDVRGTKSAGRYAPIKERKLPKSVREALMLGDAATPRSLYIRREVINASEIRKHFKAQGFGKMVSGRDMHVTIMYCRNEVDWTKAGEAYPGSADENGYITIRPGGMRLLEKFGPEGKAVVLCFASTDLQWRHVDIKEATGAKWEWPDYTPHITLTYEGADIDISKVKPFIGKIVLGPEIFEEAKDGWSETIIEDGKAGKEKAPDHSGALAQNGVLINQGEIA